MGKHQIVIVGGGAGGIAVATSLLKRQATLDIAVVEPAQHHYYQPGWTMVGGGVFAANETERTTASVMPGKVTHIKTAVATFAPDENTLTLADGKTVSYDYLILAPGLFIDWEGIPGLADALGKGGVTSNYRYDLAPYTFELVQSLKKGRAIFTQPPMPIKCPGAPQKAMYLSCSYWEQHGTLDAMEVQFHTAGPSLFGVAAYVPPLMEYVKRYRAGLSFGSKLVRIDGPNRTATFASAGTDGVVKEITESYDMLHVTPPQKAHKFMADSALTDATGFVEVDAKTLQHVKFTNVFSLGDACNTPNSKTAAAARKQAPIVAVNLLQVMHGRKASHAYDGYGSCPLTVEHGKAILAEFGYGGKLLPSFPWDSTKPRRLAWALKARFLPWLYWNAMLKGREWLAAPLEKHEP
jgi:sulfide:quinone oxidoreductase